MRIHRPLLAFEFLFFGVLAITAFYTTPLFVDKGFTEHEIGWFFIVAYGVTILGLILAPYAMQKYGNRTVSLWTLAAAAASLITIPIATPVVALIAFVVNTVCSLILYTSLDIFIEQTTKHEGDTGMLRGIFYTASNLAFVIVPGLAALLVNLHGYSGLYAFGGLVLLLCFFIVYAGLRHIPEARYHPLAIPALVHTLKKKKDVRNIFIVQALLRTFSALMVVYMPVYLTVHLGFSLAEMGLIFSIAMVPFILIQLPMGFLADTRFGEKEFLFAGLLIMGLATLAIPFVTLHTFWVWTALLFATRIGAASVEIMSDVYFFKHMKGADAGIVSAFRILFPLSYVITPLIVGVLLLFTDIEVLFGVLGAMIIIIGLPVTLLLKDTK
ncbi:MAG: MFS transporter [Candidatus Pacebacteria bacterium]|nr:MFS transporter [Candidatus Paceibacterota bacterium]